MVYHFMSRSRSIKSKPSQEFFQNQGEKETKDKYKALALALALAPN